MEAPGGIGGGEFEGILTSAGKSSSLFSVLTKLFFLSLLSMNCFLVFSVISVFYSL